MSDWCEKCARPLPDAEVIEALRQRLFEMQNAAIDLTKQLAAAEKERDHWKANHTNRVAAAKVLIDRTDLPFERVKAYEKYVEMQEKLAASKAREQQLRDAFQTFIDEHEECSDADDWMASMCSLEALHEADSALNQDLNACHQSTTEDCSAVQTKGEI